MEGVQIWASEMRACSSYAKGESGGADRGAANAVAMLHATVTGLRG